MIAPFTLLVPVSGMPSSSVLLGEPLPGWKIQAAVLVLAGLALSLFGRRVMAALRRSPRRAVVEGC